jgi:cell division protein FtsQ
VGLGSSVANKLVPASMKQRSTYTIGAVVALAVIIVAIYLVGFTSAFSVRKVTVSGLHRLTEHGVLAVAKVPKGKPLARLDLKPIHDRVAAIPGVARVDVKRAWPDGIRIVVTERTGVAVISRGGVDWLVDKNGVAFQRLHRPLSGVPRLEPAPAQKPDAAAKAALTVAGDLPSWLRIRTITISATTPDSVTLSLTKGRTVKWGTATNDKRKADVLLPLLRRSGTVYDVESPDVVAVH